MKTLFITGVSGLLGSNIAINYKDKFNIIGVSRSKTTYLENINYCSLDITDRSQVADFFENNKVDIVIHCAAMTNVDNCENDSSLAERVNAQGTKNLLDYYDGKFIYISTDMVFDGYNENYSEEDETKPINVYGKTKLAGEKYVKENSNDYLVIRTNFFGWSHIKTTNNFAQWVLNSLLSSKPINLFNDYCYSPIFIDYLIKSIFELIDHNKQGTFHVCGNDTVSKYEFGIKLAEKFKLNIDLINKISIDDIKLEAIRPKNMSLSNNKLKKENIKIYSVDESILEFYNTKHYSLL